MSITTRAASIAYSEMDGTPLPDSDFQSPLFRRISDALDDHYRDAAAAMFTGNTFIHDGEGNPRQSIAPHCKWVLRPSAEAQESIERNNTYLLWEVGKAPDFVPG